MKKFRLYPEDSTIIGRTGTTVYLVFQDEQIAKDFHELMEKFRGREFHIQFDDSAKVQ